MRVSHPRQKTKKTKRTPRRYDIPRLCARWLAATRLHGDGLYWLPNHMISENHIHLGVTLLVTTYYKAKL